jgi:3-isopropylmalate/(R)-2-methylmalate dehydratase small subunit
MSETPIVRIERVSGPAIVVRGDDIDTDRIIPARFLKSISFAGLEKHVFEDERREAVARGAVHPFDEPAYREARVLLVNANFGCGSSREHAPQAIARRGIRAIVGESFAEIFIGNSLMIGLPCLAVSKADMTTLMAVADAQPDAEFVVDVTSNSVSVGAIRVPATLPPSSREALITGSWDATGLLLSDYSVVEEVASRLPYISGFRA